MKRIRNWQLFLLIISVVLLTGCSQKLKCKVDTIVDSNKYTSTVVVKFEDNKPSTYNFKDKMMFAALDPNAEIYYHSKYDEYGTLIAGKFARIGNHTDNISLKIKYNFTNNKSAQEDKLLVSRNDSIEVAKKKLEKVGYSCK